MGSVWYNSGSDLTPARFCPCEQRWMIWVRISLNQSHRGFGAVWFEGVGDEFCWEICSVISDYSLSSALC